MKKLYPILSLALLTALPVAAQNVMTIHFKDGTVRQYPVDDVTEMNFSQAALSKQVLVNNVLKDITKVEEVSSPFDGSQLTYKIYAETASAATPVTLTLSIPASQLSKSVELEDNADVTISSADVADLSQIKGSLKVSKDKLGTTLTIALKAEAGSNSIEAAYQGTYTKVYDTENAYSFTPYHKDVEDGTISNVFRFDAAEGTYSQFAFGSLETSTSDGLLSGNYAVILQLSSSMTQSGGTLNLKTDADQYKLRFIDFTDKVSYEADAYTEGTLTFVPLANGKVAFKIDATLTNGVAVKAEYCGETKESETFETLIPKAQAENGVRIYESDGTTVNLDQKITSLQVREKTSKGEQWLWFYFLPEGTTTPNDQQLVPLIKVNKKLIGQGEVDLTNADANTWYVSYKDIQMQSKDNDYVQTPVTSGTLSVDQDGDDYVISLKLTNYYDNPWNHGETKGDGRVVVLQYSGAGSAYTGY